MHAKMDGARIIIDVCVCLCGGAVVCIFCVDCFVYFFSEKNGFKLFLVDEIERKRERKNVQKSPLSGGVSLHLGIKLIKFAEVSF